MLIKILLEDLVSQFEPEYFELFGTSNYFWLCFSNRVFMRVLVVESIMVLEHFNDVNLLSQCSIDVSEPDSLERICGFIQNITGL